MTSASSVLQRILDLLRLHGASFDLMTHEALGFTSDEVARARNVELGQCSKAVVLKVKGNGMKQFVLAVLPGDEKVDTGKLARVFGGTRASFVSGEDVLSLTGCVPGALAPFSFRGDLALVVDPSLFERYSRIAFNAGTLTETIIMEAGDYRRIVQPWEIRFI